VRACVDAWMSVCVDASVRAWMRGCLYNVKDDAEEKEGEVDMTSTEWGQQQPDHVVSIEETKLKKRGAP